MFRFLVVAHDHFQGIERFRSTSRVFRRSLFIVQDVKAGELLTGANVRCIRPGYGLPPKHWDQVVGRRAACDITRGTPLDWKLIAGAAA